MWSTGSDGMYSVRVVLFVSVSENFHHSPGSSTVEHASAITVAPLNEFQTSVIGSCVLACWPHQHSTRKGAGSTPAQVMCFCFVCLLFCSVVWFGKITQNQAILLLSWFCLLIRGPRGPMDKARDYESRDWGFESLRGWRGWSSWL